MLFRDRTVDPVAKPLRTARILWFAILTGTVAALVVAELLGERGSFPVGPADLTVTASLVLAAGVLVVASLVVPRVIRRAALARLTLATAHDVDAGADAFSFRRAAPSRMRFDDRPAALAAVTHAVQPAFIVGMVCAEGVALLGIVSAFQGVSRGACAAFWGVSWALMATHFPTRTRIEQLAGVYLAAKGPG